MLVPSWVRVIIRHQIFKVPQKGAIILTTAHTDLIGFRRVLRRFHGLRNLKFRAFGFRGLGVEGLRLSMLRQSC